MDNTWGRTGEVGELVDLHGPAAAAEVVLLDLEQVVPEDLEPPGLLRRAGVVPAVPLLEDLELGQGEVVVVAPPGAAAGGLGAAAVAAVVLLRGHGRGRQQHHQCKDASLDTEIC